MTYAFRNATTQGNASGGALSVTKPTGTIDGDLIVVLAYLETDTNTWSSVGSGFLSAGTFTNATKFKMQVWWKIASGEPASWTWTPASSAWRTVDAASYSGATGSGGTRVDVFGTAASGNTSTTASTPSVTTTVASDLLTACLGNFQGNSWGYTSGPASNIRANLGGVAILDAPNQAQGATGATVVNAGTMDYAIDHVAFFLDTGGGATGPPPPFPPDIRVIRY